MTKSKFHPNRRQFIKKGLAGSALLGLNNPLKAAINQFQVEKMPYNDLGNTGLTVSRAGVGGWQIGTSDLDQDIVNDIVEVALDEGINYFDTAPNYGNSEERLGIALKGNREKVVIATKTEEQSREGTWKLIEQSLERLHTDYLDIVFLHSLGNQQRFTDIPLLISEQGGWQALKEAKEQGVVKYIGVSGHNYPSLFHKLLDTGKVDVLMNAVNFVSQHVYNFEDKIWARAHQEQIGLVAMKVLGGANDQGIRIPAEHYPLALQYALFEAAAHTAVVGMETPEQVKMLSETVKGIKEMNENEVKAAYRLGLDLSEADLWKAPYGPPTT